REISLLTTLERFNTQHRDSELRWLIDKTAMQEGPYVLAGDFNIAAGSYGNRSFPSRWRDAYAAAGRGFGHTFPAPSHENSRLIPFPLIRIDYVLGSPGV